MWFSQNESTQIKSRLLEQQSSRLEFFGCLQDGSSLGKLLGMLEQLFIEHTLFEVLLRVRTISEPWRMLTSIFFGAPLAEEIPIGSALAAVALTCQFAVAGAPITPVANAVKSCTVAGVASPAVAVLALWVVIVAIQPHLGVGFGTEAANLVNVALRRCLDDGVSRFIGSGQRCSVWPRPELHDEFPWIITVEHLLPLLGFFWLL